MSDNIIKKILNPSERGKVWWLFVIIIVAVLFFSLVDAGSYYNKGVDYLAYKTGDVVKLPHMKEVPFRLGLDLQGGTHLVYHVDMSQVGEKDKASALEGVRDVIERRVNVFGVSEPLVQTSNSGGENRLVVELAGISDVNKAINMIGETPLLEFKEKTQKTRELTEEEKSAMDKHNLEAKQKAEDILGKLLSGGDFSALAREYSDDTNTKDNGGDLGWITSSDHPFEVNAVKDFKIGEVSNSLVTSEQGFSLFKLEDKREKANPFNEKEVEKEVKASHLLLCFDGIEGCNSGLTKEEAYKKIKEIKAKATPQNFASLVEKYTTEPGGAARKGELGWFSKGKMVAPFEDTVFPQKVGTISYVVETQFGYHLIYKEDERVQEEFKVGRIFIAKISKKDIIGEEKEWKNTELTGKNLKRSTVQFNPNDGTPEVSLEFDGEGADMFAKITERNIGSPVAIFLDGDIISQPTVNEKITGGRAVINGHFSVTEAKTLAQRLNAGALPVPINLISQQTVGASLGHSSLMMSLKAGVAGLLLVALFMILYYRLPGLAAVLSLGIYGIVILGIFKLVPVTLSLSGLAGFILSIGMAVDANVLIFERLKEEMKEGRPLSVAIENSFERAWPSIRDGNVSTIITSLILLWFSTSIVKGFALTLLIGILVSMLSAIYVTRNFLRIVGGEWLEKRTWLLGAKKENS